MQTRPIPSSGEALPVIGCGTYVGFDVGANSDKFKALMLFIRSATPAVRYSTVRPCMVAPKPW